MTCERYWREGILLVEQGLPDPHRASCADCRRAHDARDELVRALPAIQPAVTGDPQWQARVWQQLAHERRRAPSRRTWWLGGAVAAACAITLVLIWLGRGRVDAPVGEPVASLVPHWEGIQGSQVTRAAQLRVGDRVRVFGKLTDDVRVYRADQLVARCTQTALAPGCTRDRRGVVAEVALATAGEYQLVIISNAPAAPAGVLDHDLAAVVTAGGTYRILEELSIR